MSLKFPYSEIYGKNVYVNSRVNIRAIPYEDRETYKDEKGQEHPNIRFVAEPGTTPGKIFQLYTNPNGKQWFAIKWSIGGTGNFGYGWIQIGKWINERKFLEQGARTSEQYRKDKEKEEKERKEKEEEENKSFGEKALDMVQQVAFWGIGAWILYKVVIDKPKNTVPQNG